ncbi:MAG: tetratricopeptide repeat protein, partial [Acidobacteria bacterium]|nr:tetratricopeptide repeat protein [Acidobacteriota bacterium]
MTGLFRNESNFSTSLGSFVLVAGLVALFALPASARNLTAVQIEAVNEQGQPMPELELVLKPVGETTGTPRVAKADRRGSFKARIPAGEYVIDVKDTDKYFIKEAEVDIKDSSGLLLREYEVTVHPVQGMSPIPMKGAQITTMKLVVTGAAYRNRLLRDVEVGAVKSEFDQLQGLYQAGEYQQALELGNQIMESMTTQVPEVLFLVGMTHAQLDQFEQAESLLRQAVELAPDDAELKASLGTLLLQVANQKHAREENARPEFAEAEKWLGLAVSSMDPVPVQLLINQSIALEGAGQSEAAIEVMERVVAEDPDNLAVRFRMAALLRSSGQPERALEVLDSLPSITDPRAADTLYNLGLTFYTEGDFGSAVSALSRAEEADADHALVQRLLGRTYYAMGEPAKALPHLRRFLELDPDPYLVVDDGRLFWIQDAYTVAGGYPYSEPV